MYGFWPRWPLRPAWYFSGLASLFSALTFDQSRLGLRDVLRVTGCPFGVESARLLALAEHQGMNVGLVLIPYQLFSPMRGPVLVKSGAHGQGARLVMGPLL